MRRRDFLAAFGASGLAATAGCSVPLTVWSIDETDGLQVYTASGGGVVLNGVQFEVEGVSGVATASATPDNTEDIHLVLPEQDESVYVLQIAVDAVDAGGDLAAKIPPIDAWRLHSSVDGEPLSEVHTTEPTTWDGADVTKYYVRHGDSLKVLPAYGHGNIEAGLQNLVFTAAGQPSRVELGTDAGQFQWFLDGPDVNGGGA